MRQELSYLSVTLPSMATPDSRRVLIAQLIGTAGGYGHLQRLTRDQAIAELAEAMVAGKVRPGSLGAVDLLTHAAVFYAGTELTGPAWWYGRPLELWAAAGADLVEAERIRPSRSRGSLRARLSDRPGGSTLGATETLAVWHAHPASR